MRRRDFCLMSSTSAFSLSLALGPLGSCAAPGGGRSPTPARAGAPPATPPGSAAPPAPPAAPPPPPPPEAGPALVAEAALGPLAVRKWRLANGLSLITLPDPGATAVAYVTYFRVGSRDEEGASGGTGLAHLFEHLMFTQTKGAAALGEFDRLMEEAGGSANAMTAHDYTAYSNELPPEALDRAITLEADRMVNLDLRAAQVENERDVVLEERLATVDDSVDGALDELMYKQAFRRHPYRWPIIGWAADVRAVTRARAVAFYRRHYEPARALVVVAGRFDEPAALRAIQRAYGPIPAARAAPGDAAAAIAPELAPAAAVRASIRRPVPADRLALGYPAPALGDPDRPAYEALAELLVGGPSSRLNRELVVERGLASSVRGELAPTRDPALWAIWVQMARGRPAEKAEQRILRAAERAAREEIPPAALGAVQSRLEAALWEELGSSHGKAEALGEFDVVTGDFRNLLGRAQAFRDLRPADLTRVARRYLEPGARSVVIARPKGAKQ
jgi:zinc protease